MTSKHYLEERAARELIVKKIGIGKIVDSFVVDRSHRNGPEIHEITSTGIIIIRNQRTHKMITKLIARPGQIKRYYKKGEAPAAILDIAFQNTVVFHYNE